MVLAASATASKQRRRLDQRWIRFGIKPLVFLLCLLPLAWMVKAALTGGLGANPIEAINRFLGDWALRFLLITLTVRPTKEIFGLPTLMRFRRLLGLFAFFYASLHITSYVAVDQFFHWSEIWADIVKRRYITIGLITFALLLPLAVTSTKGMIKRLGAKRWQRLHWLIYPAAMLAIVHFYMMVKADVREPLVYGGIVALLLGYRVAVRFRKVPSRSGQAQIAR